MTTQHGGADFRQNFGQHTAAQISASTRRHRCSPKNFARKKFAGRRPANFFRDRLGRTGFYDQKGLFYDRKGFRFDATSFARGGRRFHKDSSRFTCSGPGRQLKRSKLMYSTGSTKTLRGPQKPQEVPEIP